MGEQIVKWLSAFGLKFENTTSIEDVIVFLALLATILSIWLTYSLSKKADERETRVEKSTAYMQLETHSSEIFKYQADNFQVMKAALNWKPTQKGMFPPKTQPFEMTRQFYLQCLNLFEVASNFRKKHIVDHGVYASWVAWFWELTGQNYFRDIWDRERENYTDDVRNIFDAGIALFDHELDDEVRKRIFYRAVAMTMIEPRDSWRMVVVSRFQQVVDLLAELTRWLTRKPKTEACEEIEGWLDKCNDNSDAKARVAQLVADARRAGTSI